MQSQGSQSVWTSWPGGIGYPTAIPLKGGKGRKTRKARKASKKTRKARKGTRRMRGGNWRETLAGWKEQAAHRLGLNAQNTEKKPNGVNQAQWNNYLQKKKNYNYVMAIGKLAAMKKRKKANIWTPQNQEALNAFYAAVEPIIPGAVGTNAIANNQFKTAQKQLNISKQLEIVQGRLRK